MSGNDRRGLERRRAQWKFPSKDQSPPMIAMQAQGRESAAGATRAHRGQMIRAFTFMPCSEEEIIDASRTRREKSRRISEQTKAFDGMEVLAQICEMRAKQKQVDASSALATPLSGPRTVHFQDDDGSDDIQSDAGMFNGSTTPEATMNSSSWLQLLPSPSNGRDQEPSVTAVAAKSPGGGGSIGQGPRDRSADSGRGRGTRRTPVPHPTGGAGGGVSASRTPPPEICPPANPWHRWSVAVGLTPRQACVSADSRELAAPSAQSAVQRREAPLVPERESTPPGLTRRELRESNAELPSVSSPWRVAQPAASAEGGSWWARLGRVGGAGTPPADPTVALLVQRLEVASSDAGYFRHKADSSLALAFPKHASSPARAHGTGAWAAAHAWGVDEAEDQALGTLARGKMALRLQSLSTAALTISLDACWCKAELASVLRALQDYNELALPEAGEPGTRRGVAAESGSGRACSRVPVAESIERLASAGDGSDSAMVGTYDVGSGSARRSLTRRLEEREAQLAEREDEVAVLRALLEEAHNSLDEKDAALARRAADLDAQTRRVELLLSQASPDADGSRALPTPGRPPGSSTPPSAKMKATASFKGAAVQKLAAVFESGGNVVETQAAQVLFASGKLEETLFARSPRGAIGSEATGGEDGSGSSGSSDSSASKNDNTASAAVEWDRESDGEAGLGASCLTEQDLERRLKGLSSSCHGGVTAGVGMEELRAAHASTQDALAAQTLEFHVFKQESKEKVRRLSREVAEGREREAQAKKDRQGVREEMQRKMQALNKELLDAREAQARWLQDKAKLQAKLTAQDASIDNLKAQVDSLRRHRPSADAAPHADAASQSAELADAIKRLDLALLSVNNEQERANTAEFALLHEKEERRALRRAMHDMDAELASTADACEVSVQRLILSLARVLQPLVAERDLRDAALRAQSARAPAGWPAPLVAADASRATNTSSAASSCSGSLFREPSRGENEFDGTSSSVTGKESESEALRLRLSKMEDELQCVREKMDVIDLDDETLRSLTLRSVKVQKQMLESMRMSGGVPALGFSYTCGKCGEAQAAGANACDVVEGLEAQLAVAEAGLRDGSAQKQALAGLDLDSLSVNPTSRDVSTLSIDGPGEWDGKFQFAESARIENERHRAALARVALGLRVLVRDMALAQDDMAEACAAVANQAEAMHDSLEQSMKQVKMLQTALREAQVSQKPPAAPPGGSPSAAAAAEIRRLQAVIECVRAAGVVVEELTPDQDDPPTAACVRLPPPAAAPWVVVTGDDEAAGSSDDGRESEAPHGSSTKAAIRRSRERRSRSPVPPQSEEAPQSSAEADLPAPADRSAADGRGRGVVEESSTADSVRAQVSLIESLFGRAGPDSRPTGGERQRGPVTGSPAHAKPLTQQPSTTMNKISSATASQQADIEDTKEVAKVSPAEGSSDGSRRDAATGNKSRHQQDDDTPKATLDLPSLNDDELPEMEEVYTVAKRAEALFPYSPEEEDELHLKAGEALYVLGLSQPDWLVAVRAGKTPAEIGLVPENYVKVTEPVEAAGEENAGTLSEPAGTSTASSPLPTPKFDATLSLASRLEAASEAAGAAAGGNGASDGDEYLDTPTGPPIFSRSATRAFRFDEEEDEIVQQGPASKGSQSAGTTTLVSRAAAADPTVTAGSSSPVSSSSVDMDDLMQDMYSPAGGKKQQETGAGAGAATAATSGSPGAAVAAPGAAGAGPGGPASTAAVTAEGCPAFDEDELPEIEERYESARHAKALYKYSAQEDDELTVDAGEALYVLGLSQPDWLVAVRAGKSPAEIGLLPENYVKMLS